jgi:hypothetical protein
MPSYRNHSPSWCPPPGWKCASNLASSFDPGAGQLALHPGSARTRPSTLPESTMPHAFAVFLTNIGFTPRTSFLGERLREATGAG